MCHSKARKVDYKTMRYMLLHVPDCTKRIMKRLNEVHPDGDDSFCLQIHENPDEVDFNEPFGAILWRQRVKTGYPLCLAADLTGLTQEELLRAGAWDAAEGIQCPGEWQADADTVCGQ